MSNQPAEIGQQLFSTDLRNLSASNLITLSRKISKAADEIRQNHPELISVRIAVTGTSNIQFFTAVLKPFLFASGLNPDIFEGQYAGLDGEIRDENSSLYRFNPDIVIAVTGYRDIHEFPDFLSPAAEVDKLADEKTDEILSVWEKFHQHCNAKVYLTNYAVSNRHILGAMEANLSSSPDQFIRLINHKLLMQKPGFMQIIDQESIAADYGKDRWFDDSAWFISKQPFALEALPFFCYALARQIASGLGKLKKCLVVDLDNTLWGGVIGDDGLEGINLDPNNAVGEAYLDFQKTLRKFKERGVLLSVCSKNEEQTALKVFSEHPQMILTKNDFAAFIANWDDKATNLRKIAEQLNIGLDSMVFFDDNPAERQLIRTTLPMVEVIEVPEDPAAFSLALTRAHCFDWEQLTPEDLRRTESIRSNQEREALSASLDYAGYLKALQMIWSAAIVSPQEVMRFTQLINKTNQFNLRTRRYSESEIAELAADPNSLLLRVTLKDKFSDYGIISALILKKDLRNRSLFIDTWVMSCRVFQRRLEYEVMNWLVNYAGDHDIQKIIGEYIPTGRNKLVENFYPETGFQLTEQVGDTRIYQLMINDYVPCETWFLKEITTENE